MEVQIEATGKRCVLMVDVLRMRVFWEVTANALLFVCVLLNIAG